MPERTGVALRCLLILLMVWLTAAAALVDVEYYDGFDSVLNARFYTGQRPTYVYTRGPLLGLLLVPAEWVRQALHLHPLDTRPHHAVMAVLHAGYLVGAWVFLRRAYGARPATVLAFAAAVPSFVFFSYAPFVSHDIWGGVLLLAMLVLAVRFARRQSVATWGGLVVLGVLAVTLKHLYAVFWLAVLAGEVAQGAREGSAGDRRRRLLLLAAGMAATGVVSYLVLCFPLGSLYPGEPFLLRGWKQVAYLLNEAHDHSRVEPVWIYLRNLPAYGILAGALVLPGLWSCWRGTPLQRRVAVAWGVVLACYHLLPLRQVREIAFLGAATAFLSVPPLQWLLRYRGGLAVALAGLALNLVPLHPYCIPTEAARIISPFYRRSPVRAFLDHLAGPDGGLRTPIILNWRMLSFVPERDSPFVADIYHDIFHFGAHQLAGLYGLGPDQIIALSPQQLGEMRDWPEGATMILTTAAPIINHTSWQRQPAENKYELRQVIFESRVLTLRRDAGGSLRLDPGGAVEARAAMLEGVAGTTLGGAGLRQRLDDGILAKMRLPGVPEPISLVPRDDGYFAPGLHLPPASEAMPAVRLQYFAPIHVQQNPRPAD